MVFADAIPNVVINNRISWSNIIMNALDLEVLFNRIEIVDFFNKYRFDVLV